jgi:hypothetical protein
VPKDKLVTFPIATRFKFMAIVANFKITYIIARKIGINCILDEEIHNMSMIEG